MRQILLIILCSFTFQLSSACSIFSCFKNGKMLVGSNEDGDYPFSYIRTVPSEKNRYGAIFFGTSDMQAQSGVNEHGLFFDYSALPPGEIDTSKLRSSQMNGNDCTSYSSLLHSAKNVEEFLEALEAKPYNILSSQLLIADAEGKSAIINAEGILRGGGDFQISTNFNAWNAIEGDYKCSRYDRIKENLSTTPHISEKLFKDILNEVHVEGEVATQYSNVFDLKEGKIYLNFFHDYQETVIIDVDTELRKGFSIKPISKLFSKQNFITQLTLQRHPEYYRELLENEFDHNGYKAGIKIYEKLKEQNPSDVEEIEEGLISAPFALIARSRAEFDGQPLFFYYQKDLHYCKTFWRSDNLNLRTALKIQDYLKEKSLIQEGFSYYEDLGYIHMVLGNYKKANYYFLKAQQATGEGEDWRKERILNMLKYNQKRISSVVEGHSK